MSINERQIVNIIEGALLAAGEPVSIERLLALFDDGDGIDRAAVRKALEQLDGDYAERGVELKEVASGWRLQVRESLAPWVSRLWEQRPARYSRALLETLALIAYQQPVTRSDIEQVRGVSVSSNIIKTLLERDWIRIVGHRDVPGRPALYGTTRAFLDYFNLKTLDELPPLAEIRDLEKLNPELDLSLDEEPDPDAGEAAASGEGTGDDVAGVDDADADAAVADDFVEQGGSEAGVENEAAGHAEDHAQDEVESASPAAAAEVEPEARPEADATAEDAAAAADGAGQEPDVAPLDRQQS